MQTFILLLVFCLPIRNAYALAMSDDDKKCVDETEKTTWSYDKNGDASIVTYEDGFISLSAQPLTGGIRIKKKSDGNVIKYIYFLNLLLIILINNSFFDKKTYLCRYQR